MVFEKNVDAAAAAQAVALGLGDAGFEVDIAPASGAPAAAGHPLVFIGASAGLLGIGSDAKEFIEANDWRGRSVALFFAVDAFGRKALESAAASLFNRGALVRGTIGLRRGGLLGTGALLEIELARARAFGERAGNSLRGIRVKKRQEKARIPFYKK